MNRSPLAPLLARRLGRDSQLVDRLVARYAQLRALPRRVRRRLGRARLSLALSLIHI